MIPVFLEGGCNISFLKKMLILVYKLYITQSKSVKQELDKSRDHCLISYGGGLGMSPCITGLTTQDPYIQKEHTKLYKILKFRVNWANIEQDTAI